MLKNSAFLEYLEGQNVEELTLTIGDMDDKYWTCQSPKSLNIHPCYFTESVDGYVPESPGRAVLLSLLVVLGDVPRALCELRQAGSRSHEKCSHPPQQCSSDQLPAAFPGFIKKQSGLFGTGWDLSVPGLMSWLVSLQWHLQEAALTEAEGDDGSFSSLMFDLADTKGAGSMWQPPELAVPSLSVQII